MSFSTDDCEEDGYIYHKILDLCWKPYSMKVTYTVALQTCQNDRGRLLRIDSHEIWEYLKQMLGNFAILYMYYSVQRKVKRWFCFT